MTEQQTADDNALIRELERKGRHRAAERIKSLKAEVERLTHDFTVVSTQYIKAMYRDKEYRADRQRMREALELAAGRLDAAAKRSSDDGDIPAAVGYREWAQEARNAYSLNPASRETAQGG